MDLTRVVNYDPQTIEDDGNVAAVLVPIIEHANDPHVLLTKRAETLPKHPGQMSFPGGSREPVDQNARETAIREATEEVGVQPDQVDIVGHLDDITTTSNYVVTPIVGRIPHRTYEPNDSEVAEVTIIPLDAFLDPQCYEFEWREAPDGSTYRVHYFHVDPYLVWGATGRILVQFLSLTMDWELPESALESRN